MLDTLSRARLLDRIYPSVCTCGAGEDAIQHSSNCQVMIDFEAKMRQAKSELRQLRRCELGQVVYLR